MNRISSTVARAQTRADVRMIGVLTCCDAVVECLLVDVSECGLGLRLAEPLSLLPETPVTFECQELGLLRGHIVWCRGTTVGLRLDEGLTDVDFEPGWAAPH